MLARPFDDEPESARREPSGQHVEALDVDRRLIATVARMKVRASEMLDLVVVSRSRSCDRCETAGNTALRPFV